MPTLDELLATYPAPFRSPLEKALIAEVERLEMVAATFVRDALAQNGELNLRRRIAGLEAAERLAEAVLVDEEQNDHHSEQAVSELAAAYRKATKQHPARPDDNPA